MSTQQLRNRDSKELLRQIKRLPAKERRFLAEETLKSIRQSANNKLVKAVKKLRDDYRKDGELTAFTSLDSDSFYETR